MPAKKLKERPILMSGNMVRAILAGRKTQTRRILSPQPIHSRYNPPIHAKPGNFYICPDMFPTEEPGGLVVSYCSTPGITRCMGQEQFIESHGKYHLGDHLWVKETHGFWCHSIESVGVEYAAGGGDKIVDFPDGIGMPSLEVQCRKNIDGGRRKRPSIFMPRWASRIDLQITKIRVERLQNISAADSIAEGIQSFTKDGTLKKYWPCDFCDGDFKRPWAELPRTAQEAYKALWEHINGYGSWATNPWVWVIEFRRVEGKTLFKRAA